MAKNRGHNDARQEKLGIIRVNKMNIKQENLDLSFGQNYDVPLMTLILDELKARYKVIEKKQLDGIDQSYWDLKINGFSFCTMNTILAFPCTIGVGLSVNKPEKC